jgi:hypothetical protein
LAVGDKEAILGEAIHPHGALAVCEFQPETHIGRTVDVRLMTGDQIAVLYRHQVRLDIVSPLLDGQRSNTL